MRSDHEDLRTDPCDLVKNLNIGHSLNMATAYETCNGQEAQYTNYTEDKGQAYTYRCIVKSGR